MAFIKAGGKNSASRRAAELELNLGVKLDGGNDKLRFFILSTLSKNLDKYIKSRVPIVEGRIRNVIVRKLEDSFAWQSVIRGELNQLLEIKNAQLVMAQVKRVILDGLFVKLNTLTIEGSNLRGGISIGLNVSNNKLLAILPDYEHLGQKVNWLRWILEGTEVNVFNLNIDYEKEITTLDEAKEDITDDFGVADLRDTFLKENPNAGFGFGIVGLPLEFRGDIDDNFLTRSLEGLDEEIEQILKEEINP